MSAVVSAVKSILFCSRNVEKKVEENRLKEPVIICQAWNAANYLSKIGDIDSKVVKGTKSAVDAFRLAGESNNFIKNTCKVLDFGGKYVNGVIAATAGAEILLSDDEDKLSLGLQRGAGIIAMLGAEQGVLKPYLKDSMEYISKIKGVDKVVEKVMKSVSKYKYGHKLPEIVEGAAFVAGSALASSVGEKFGSMVARQIKPETEKKAA